MHKSFIPLGVSLLAASSAQAQLLTPTIATPSLDRWMYPFNGSPGFRLEVAAFGATLLEGFDDHDAQVLVGFDTTGDITPGLGADEYRVIEATLTVTVSNDLGFTYDDTYDSYTTYTVSGEPEILDPDPGRPLNLFLVGYRDGFDQTTFNESTAFGFVPEVEPAQGMRRAFAAQYDSAGVATDISNHLKEMFEAEPLAIGVTDTVAPGQLVPSDTEFTFSFSPCDAGTGLELARMLDLGELRLMVTSLNPASGGPDGGEGNYPVFYSKENPIAQLFGYTATLSLRVRVGDEGDFNGDGSKDFFDVSAFLSALSSDDPAADLTGDCQFDFFDVSAFLSAFAAE
jgi:hypothetical protein